MSILNRASATEQAKEAAVWRTTILGMTHFTNHFLMEINSAELSYLHHNQQQKSKYIT
jgi:hypothetical protein